MSPTLQKDEPLKLDTKSVTTEILETCIATDLSSIQQDNLNTTTNMNNIIVDYNDDDNGDDYDDVNSKPPHLDYLDDDIMGML